MVVASALGALLVSLLATAWATFGRPALEVEARARIAQEGILATQSIACDLAGFLPDSPGQTGTLGQYSFVDWDLSSNNALLLNFQGASSDDIVVISYALNGNKLQRFNSSTGMTTTVASYVTGFSVSQDPNNAQQALISIQVSFRYFSASYSLVGVSPS